MAFGFTDFSNYGYRPPVNGYPYNGYLYRHKRSNPWFKIALGMAIGATVPFAFTRLKAMKPITQFISSAFKPGGNIKEFFRGLFKYAKSPMSEAGPGFALKFTIRKPPQQLTLFGPPPPRQLSIFPREVVRAVKETMRHPRSVGRRAAHQLKMHFTMPPRQMRLF